VIFISFSVRLQFFAAFGKFHFAANNISIDCRVSGLIIVADNYFFVKGVFVEIHKNLLRRFFAGIFFPPFLELKAKFPSENRVCICKSIITKVCTTHFEKTKEFVNGITLNNTLLSQVRVKTEGLL